MVSSRFFIVLIARSEETLRKRQFVNCDQHTDIQIIFNLRVSSLLFLWFCLLVKKNFNNRHPLNKLYNNLTVGNKLAIVVTAWRYNGVVKCQS